jgi:hypothetical protein
MTRHPRLRRIILAILPFVFSLAAGAAAFAGPLGLEKPTEEQLIARGYRFAGEKNEDKFHEIPGDETTIRIYRKGQDTVGLYILRNGAIYGFAVKTGAQPITAYIDEYNTGYCSKDVSAGENFLIDMRAYRVAPGTGKARGRE